jgi:very-short-patch-repair endonuclease
MKYADLSETNKKKIINDMYLKKNMSFKQMASELSTYPNKIRRDAKSFGIAIRDKSEAQKNALNNGNHKHPTKGKQRDIETKIKIGQGIIKSWENLSEEEINNRKNKAKKQWEQLSTDDRANLVHSANVAVRESSKHGSKLEKFLFKELINAGYEVHFHQEQTLSNTKLQIDIFLPKLNTAIEIDGPSHFLPVWGQDVLDRNIKYDNKKTGLLLGKGCVLIRVKQLRDFSPTRARMVLSSILAELEKIKNKFPDSKNRLLEIED